MVDRPVDRSVTAVDRTLTILNAFLGGDGIRSLSELETMTGLFKSVICRYMLSFERYGYIVKRPDGRYQLGSQVMRLGRVFENAFDISQYVLPLLRELVEHTQESGSFYIREGDMRLCLYRVDSPSVLRVAIHPGTMLPIDDSATGQVFMHFKHGYQSAQRVEPTSFIRMSANHTNSGVPDYVASASMPVFGLDDGLAGALTLSGPMPRFDPYANEEARIALIEAAITLSSSLGGRGYKG